MQAMESQDAGSSELVGPDGREVSSEDSKQKRGAKEVEVEVASGRGEVYVRLPTGQTLELSPQTAKSLGGSLINESRSAESQRKKMER